MVIVYSHQICQDVQVQPRIRAATSLCLLRNSNVRKHDLSYCWNTYPGDGLFQYWEMRVNLSEKNKGFMLTKMWATYWFHIAVFRKHVYREGYHSTAAWPILVSSFVETGSRFERNIFHFKTIILCPSFHKCAYGQRWLRWFLSIGLGFLYHLRDWRTHSKKIAAFWLKA